MRNYKKRQKKKKRGTVQQLEQIAPFFFLLKLFIFHFIFYFYFFLLFSLSEKPRGTEQQKTRRKQNKYLIRRHRWPASRPPQCRNGKMPKIDHVMSCAYKSIDRNDDDDDDDQKLIWNDGAGAFEKVDGDGCCGLNEEGLMDQSADIARVFFCFFCFFFLLLVPLRTSAIPGMFRRCA